MKGSTVNRKTLEKDEFRNKGLDAICQKYNSKVLKDVDFTELKFKFKLSKKDAQTLLACVEEDAKFLRSYNLTDYSLYVTVHSYDKYDFEQAFRNPRIMKSTCNSYLYNFAIIDFLTVYFIYIDSFRILTFIKKEKYSSKI
jgi:hypothetical protein